MKTFDRYILTEFFRVFLLSMIVMIAFYEMVSFIDMAGYFFKFKATFDMIFRFMLFRVPMGLFHVTPICVLLASVLTVSSMSRFSELVAMKSAGVSLLRMAMPIIVAAGAISVLSFLDSEYLFHLAAKETNRIYYEEIKKQPRKGLFSNDKFWYKADDGDIWNIGHIDTKKGILRELSIFRFDKNKTSIVSRVNASKGRYAGGEWILSDYLERTFSEGGKFTEKYYKEKTLPKSAVPIADLTKVQLDPDEMNLDQMRAYIHDIRSKGYDATRYIVKMHSKIAFPLISLVMPLLAIPLGARSSRGGGIMVGISISVIIGVGFWFSFSTSLAFGEAGRLPPALSAYGTHSVFAMTGLYMLMTDNQ